MYVSIWLTKCRLKPKLFLQLDTLFGIKKCEKTYEQRIFIHIINGNSLHLRMQGQGSRDQLMTTFLYMHKHWFKRGYLSAAYLIYKLTCRSPESRHAAECQVRGLCAKMVMCYVTCPRYHCYYR